MSIQFTYLRQEHAQNSCLGAWCCTLLFFKTWFKLLTKHKVLLTIMTLILKKPVIVHHIIVTQKKRIYYKTSLFSKFCFFPQNIVSLQNKITWTSRTKSEGPFYYFWLNTRLIFTIAMKLAEILCNTKVNHTYMIFSFCVIND